MKPYLAVLLATFLMLVGYATFASGALPPVPAYVSIDGGKLAATVFVALPADMLERAKSAVAGHGRSEIVSWEENVMTGVTCGPAS